MSVPTKAEWLALSPSQRERLDAYLDALLEENQQFNLTALRSREEAWERHILECLRVAPFFSPAKNLIDVGTGGGLPGIVLAVVHPSVRVTLLEATEKKVAFLRRIISALELKNAMVVCERAEKAGAVGSSLRGQFDFVTARALAPLPTLLELTAPFAAPSAKLIFIKGRRAEEELSQASRALQALGVKHEETLRQETATLLLLTKAGPTPTRYPRRSGEPKKKPL